MAASMVVGLTQALRDAGADWCVVGGWGVEALFGGETREHKDLDVFVRRDQLPAAFDVLAGAGFGHAYAWEENQPVDVGGPCAGHDSAFVMTDGDGGEVDVHVYPTHGDTVEPLWRTDLTFVTSDLTASGVIARLVVRCLTPERQLESHRGYELPAAHLQDVERLRRLLGDPRNSQRVQ